MVTPIQNQNVGRLEAPGLEGAQAASEAREIQSAILLALASTGRQQGGERVAPTHRATNPEQARAAAAISGALIGNPEMLLGLISSEMRASRRETEESGALIEKNRVEQAEIERQKALEAAMKAAEESSGFLGLGDFWGDIAKVAAVVVAAAATVATGGTAGAVILAVAGIALAAYSDDITNALVEAGVVPKELAPYVSAALKIVGAAMTGGGALVVGGAALAAAAQPTAQVLQDAGVAPEVAAAVAAAMVVAGTVMGAAGGASASDAADTATDAAAAADAAQSTVTVAADATAQAGRVVETGSRVNQGVSNALGAEAAHREELHTVEGERQQAVSDDANEAIDEHIQQLESAMKSYQRMLAIVMQVAQARQASMAAASQSRA
jgi:hypothetical protein